MTILHKIIMLTGSFFMLSPVRVDGDIPITKTVGLLIEHLLLSSIELALATKREKTE